MPRKKKTNMTTTTAAASTPRTLEQKLEAAQALVAKYQQQIKSAAIVNNVEVGDEIDFTFGRGAKKRDLSGKITAIKDDETFGRLVAVLSGEGFDATSYKVRVADITENRTAAERDAPAASDAAGSNPLDAE